MLAVTKANHTAWFELNKDDLRLIFAALELKLEEDLSDDELGAYEVIAQGFAFAIGQIVSDEKEEEFIRKNGEE